MLKKKKGTEQSTYCISEINRDTKQIHWNNVPKNWPNHKCKDSLPVIEKIKGTLSPCYPIIFHRWKFMRDRPAKLCKLTWRNVRSPLENGTATNCAMEDSLNEGDDPNKFLIRSVFDFVVSPQARLAILRSVIFSIHPGRKELGNKSD